MPPLSAPLGALSWHSDSMLRQPSLVGPGSREGGQHHGCLLFLLPIAELPVELSGLAPWCRCAAWNCSVSLCELLTSTVGFVSASLHSAARVPARPQALPHWVFDGASVCCALRGPPPGYWARTLGGRNGIPFGARPPLLDPCLFVTCVLQSLAAWRRPFTTHLPSGLGPVPFIQGCYRSGAVLSDLLLQFCVKHAQVGAPKSCIGGSGTAAQPACNLDFNGAAPCSPLLAFLAACNTMITPFFCTLLCLGFLALWQLLGQAMPGRSTPMGLLLWGPRFHFLRPLVLHLGIACQPERPILVWQAGRQRRPCKAGAHKPRACLRGLGSFRVLWAACLCMFRCVFGVCHQQPGPSLKLPMMLRLAIQGDDTPNPRTRLRSHLDCLLTELLTSSIRLCPRQEVLHHHFPSGQSCEWRRGTPSRNPSRMSS